jgi:hypothetical protein
MLSRIRCERITGHADEPRVLDRPLGTFGSSRTWPTRSQSTVTCCVSVDTASVKLLRAFGFGSRGRLGQLLHVFVKSAATITPIRSFGTTTSSNMARYDHCLK